MKSTKYLVLVLLVVTLGTRAMCDNKKEKKALIETIKKEYTTYLFKDRQDRYASDLSASFSADSAVKVGGIERPYLSHSFQWFSDEYADPSIVEKDLTDFQFKFNHKQAVVQFRDKNLVKSAFLEKKNGEWKVILIADLPHLM